MFCNSADKRDRTSNFFLVREALSQLSYIRIGDYWEFNPDLRNYNLWHYHYAIVTVDSTGIESRTRGFFILLLCQLS